MLREGRERRGAPHYVHGGAVEDALAARAREPGGDHRAVRREREANGGDAGDAAIARLGRIDAVALQMREHQRLIGRDRGRAADLRLAASAGLAGAARASGEIGRGRGAGRRLQLLTLLLLLDDLCARLDDKSGGRLRCFLGLDFLRLGILLDRQCRLRPLGRHRNIDHHRRGLFRLGNVRRLLRRRIERLHRLCRRDRRVRGRGGRR